MATDGCHLLLSKAGWLGLDKQLFLLRLSEADLTGLTPFTFQLSGGGLADAEVFHNDLFKSPVLFSTILRTKFVETGIVKLGHLATTLIETLEC